MKKRRSLLPGLLALAFFLLMSSYFYRSLRGVRPLLKKEPALAELFTADGQLISQIQGDELITLAHTFAATQVKPVSRIIQSKAPYRIHFLDDQGNAVGAFCFGQGMLEQEGYALAVLDGPMPYDLLIPYLTP